MLNRVRKMKIAVDRTSRIPIAALFCLLTWIGLSILPARALDADKDLTQTRQDIWTPKDGLPPRDILAIAQTPDGYLWLGTRAGLVRFDGVAFKLYNSANTSGMPREMVLSLTVT